MKRRCFLIPLVMLCVFLSSCTSTGESDLYEYCSVDNASNVDCENFRSTYCYQDDYVSGKVKTFGDRIELSFTNNSKYRIVLHIEKATIATNGNSQASQIVTYKQSLQNTSHFSVSAIVVNPGKTFTEKYVALDAMDFDTYKSHKYLISEWVNDDCIGLKIPYGLQTFNGEEIKYMNLR